MKLNASVGSSRKFDKLMEYVQGDMSGVELI